MNNKSMIIIGAGLAGLSTGCYARMNGYKTHIFEHHSAPGGLCTAWQRNGYTIDGCIHFLTGCQQNAPFYSACQELGFLKNNRFRILKDFSSFLDEKTGQSLVVTSDLERLAVDMKRLAPEDEKTIDEFINGCRYVLTVFGSPPELMEFTKKYSMSVAEFAQRVYNPQLRWYITNMCLSDMPICGMFMIIGLLSVGQLGLVDGGSSNFSNAIAQQYQALGGEITYGACVEKILVDNNTAVGIRLADGSVYRADFVVSAADGYSTIFHMLDGKYIDQNISDRYEEWPLIKPMHLISFGVARTFPDESSEKIVMLKEPINTGGKDSKELRLRIFNYDSSLAPEGKTVIQASGLYTDFDYWYQLQKNRPAYEAEKTKLANAVLDRLEKIFKGISSLVEMTDVATPYTFWRYTRNHKGSWEGWMPTPDVVRNKIPHTLPGLANFYMAGQWVLPAASVPLVIDSGRNLIKILCEQEEKEFSTVLNK